MDFRKTYDQYLDICDCEIAGGGFHDMDPMDKDIAESIPCPDCGGQCKGDGLARWSNNRHIYLWAFAICQNPDCKTVHYF